MGFLCQVKDPNEIEFEHDNNFFNYYDFRYLQNIKRIINILSYILNERNDYYYINNYVSRVNK